MTDLRKAAEMVLEAWEKPYGERGQAVEDAIEALRQALDKPEIDPQALVEIAILAEREACAVVAFNEAYSDEEACHISEAIRARGEK